MRSNFEISAMQYMQAHGNSPGPTHRPILTGAIGGLLGAIASLVVQYLTSALRYEADSVGVSLWLVAAMIAVVCAAGGIIYGAVFKRAANDASGGWLFGISYGFFIWMVGPVTVWQWVVGKPLAVGTPAIGILASHLIYGLLLGGLYPFINRLTQSKMK